MTDEVDNAIKTDPYLEGAADAFDAVREMLEKHAKDGDAYNVQSLLEEIDGVERRMMEGTVPTDEDSISIRIGRSALQGLTKMAGALNGIAHSMMMRKGAELGKSHLEKRLEQLKQPCLWPQVRSLHVRALAPARAVGAGTVTRINSPAEMLRHVYARHGWDANRRSFRSPETATSDSDNEAQRANVLIAKACYAETMLAYSQRSSQYSPCSTCARPPGRVNHVTGHIFVGWGTGWQPCPACGGTERVLLRPAAEAE